MEIPELFAPLVSAPQLAAILSDVDGTLSPIVADPAAARPMPAAVEALAALADRYARVAVISGRPAGYLADFFPSKVAVSGLYGLETAVDGQIVTLPAAEPWIEVVAKVSDEAEADSPAALVERKRLSVTLHYRTAPEREADVEAWCAAAAARSGLRVHGARQSVELAPPLDTDKGTVVDQMVDGLAAVVYLGDDLGDLPAFAALDRLAAAGMHTVKVVSASTETAPAVLAAADLVVEGPAGVVALLQSLLAAS